MCPHARKMTIGIVPSKQRTHKKGEKKWTYLIYIVWDSKAPSICPKVKGMSDDPHRECQRTSEYECET